MIRHITQYLKIKNIAVFLLLSPIIALFISSFSIALVFLDRDSFVETGENHITQKTPVLYGIF